KHRVAHFIVGKCYPLGDFLERQTLCRRVLAVAQKNLFRIAVHGSDFRGALTRLLAFGCPRLADAGKEGFGWFVVRVLWRQFAAEGLGEDGGVEFGQEFGGAGVGALMRSSQAKAVSICLTTLAWAGTSK